MFVNQLTHKLENLKETFFFEPFYPKILALGKIERIMGRESAGDVTRRGTPFELWFFPRRTIVGRLVFTFLMFLLCCTSLCIVHIMYLSLRATAHGALIYILVTWQIRVGKDLYRVSRRYVTLLSVFFNRFFNKFEVQFILEKKFRRATLNFLKYILNVIVEISINF